MDYCQKIEEKFTTLGLTPRPKQVDIINRILQSFLNKKMKHVALSASTGIGKSLIAFIVSELLYELTNQARKNDIKPSFIIAHTNTLLQQYEDSYSDMFKMILVKGATNYPCDALSSAYEEITAEECIYGSSSNPPDVISKCGECEYLRIKKVMNSIPHIITNYAYFYTAKLYGNNNLKPRLITVWDEAHLKCDTFVNFMKIDIRDIVLEKNAKECADEDLADESSRLIQFRNKITDKKIREDNYLKEIEILFNIYADIEEKFKTMAQRERTDYNLIGYKKYNKKSKKYAHKKQKILDLLEYEYEHVVDIKETEVIISPVFMRDMFQFVNNSDYNLFMSATIDNEYIRTTIGMDSVEFINGGGIFDADNKKIIDCKLEGFNYAKMQNPDFMNTVGKIVAGIVEDYSDTKGIINVTSFSQLKFVEEFLNSHIINHGLKIKIYTQTRDKGLADILFDFKNDPSPSVLISPSIFEGIDLPDDECRYIIFLKAPYFSLGDKRISYILTKYPTIYEKMAIYRMVQGIGRAVRNENDYCDTYFIDGNLNKLFYSKHNHWKNEFKRYVRE